MLRQIDIAPQHISIAAPLPLVFDLLAQAAAGWLVELRGGPLDDVRAPRETGAISARVAARDQLTPIRRIELHPPRRQVALHVGGPYSGAREVALLQSQGPSTGVVLYARLPTERESADQFLKRAFEQSAREHLKAIKAAAEAQAREFQLEDEAGRPSMHGLSALTELQLLQAVGEQEEEEYGHRGHGRGVERVASSLAEIIELSPGDLEALQRAALLHDVGKVGLPRALWGAPRTLSADERRKMAGHVQVGAELAAQAALPDFVATTILHHHECWDGTGYPGRLVGKAIPLHARILAIAESVDTMLRVTYRRAALQTADAVARLEADAGHRWDPSLVRAVSSILRGKRPD